MTLTSLNVSYQHELLLSEVSCSFHNDDQNLLFFPLQLFTFAQKFGINTLQPSYSNGVLISIKSSRYGYNASLQWSQVARNIGNGRRCYTATWRSKTKLNNSSMIIYSFSLSSIYPSIPYPSISFCFQSIQHNWHGTN